MTDPNWIKNNDFQESEGLPEAGASATCKVESPNGFQYLFTLRASSGDDLLTKLSDFEATVLKANWKPLDQWAAKKEQLTLQTKACDCGGTRTYREGISKATGKPWKGWFCDNKDCKPEFLR